MKFLSTYLVLPFVLGCLLPLSSEAASRTRLYMPLCVNLLGATWAQNFASIREAEAAFRTITRGHSFVIEMEADRANIVDLMKPMVGRVVVVQVLAGVKPEYRTVRGTLSTVGNSLSIELDGYQIRIPLLLGASGIYKMAVYDKHFDSHMLLPFDRKASNSSAADHDFNSLSKKAVTLIDLDDRHASTRLNIADRLLGFVKPGERIATVHIADEEGGAVLTVGEVLQNNHDELIVEVAGKEITLLKGSGIGVISALAVLDD